MSLPVVVGPDTDAAAVDAGDALDAARDFHGAIGFGLAVDIASQADDAVDGLDIEFQSGYVAGGEQVRLHLGGDPGVVDRLVGFALGHLAIVAFLGIGIVRGSRAHRTGQQRNGEDSQGGTGSGRRHAVSPWVRACPLHAIAGKLGEQE